ncbi:SRPBCC family protein [Yinghuangia aomiensis]
MMNYPAAVTWNVDVLEPGRRLELSGPGSAGVKIRQTYALAPAPDGGTDVEVFYSVTGAAVALLGKKIREAGTSAVEESLQKLGRLCLS